MKKLYILIFILLAIQAQAEVFTVNNQMNTDTEKKIYNTLKGAHDAASSGDTIYIEGSSLQYESSSVTISKKLYLVGPGYFPGENPSVQVNKNQAEIYGLEISQGAAGLKVEGLSFSYSIDINANNVTFTHCKLQVDLLENISNLTITKCYLESLTYQYSYKVQNLLIANNIVVGNFSIRDGSSGLIINNTFDPKQSYNNFIIPAGLTLKNNILIKDNNAHVNIPNLPSAEISYNLSTSDVFGTENHNLANKDENNIFLGSDNNSTDGQYQLKENSPAKNAGEDGVDLGAFGGPDPYVLSGVPSIPVIYQLNVSGFSNDEDKLPVSIKAKSR